MLITLQKPVWVDLFSGRKQTEYIHLQTAVESVNVADEKLTRGTLVVGSSPQN